MRGDRPFGLRHPVLVTVFTPHARGSTALPKATGPVRPGLPRMRGDRPLDPSLVWRLQAFTPHARGSTFRPQSLILSVDVYPACAGIDLTWMSAWTRRTSLPRMRGDRPSPGLVPAQHPLFTPHARGSTSFRKVFAANQVVYPACAGIDHP